MFEKAGDTAVLERAMRDALTEVGAMISYEALSKAIGRDVRKHSGYNLRSARNMLERDERIFTVVVQNVGIKRVGDADAVRHIGTGRLDSIRRKSNQMKRTLERIAFDKLDQSDKLRHIGQSAICLAIGHLSKPKSVALIEKKCQNEHLPLGRTLRLFTNGDDG